MRTTVIEALRRLSRAGSAVWRTGLCCLGEGMYSLIHFSTRMPIHVRRSVQRGWE
jgi:hypothetical protein